MDIDIKEIKTLISRELEMHEALDYDNNEVSENKLNEILSALNSSCQDKTRYEMLSAVKGFADSGEIHKRKLYLCCFEFFESVVQSKTVNENGEEIQQHTYLEEDDLTKLYNFVKRHSADSTFDKTVYAVMDKHGMEPPQVYKNAMMRRQDFSRVMEIGNTSVTRRMAWQIIIGLHCDMDEADAVLFSAGYIRRNSAFDLTMEYFIKHQNYDIMAINEVLYELGLKVFSCHKPVSDK